MASKIDLSVEKFSMLSVNLMNLANVKSDFLNKYYKVPDISPLTIGDFILYQKIGKGAFASVYISVDKKTRKDMYAMKVLKKHKVIKEQQVDHVKSEKRLLDSVQSVFIIKLLHYFQDQSNLYLALEYIPGGELFKLLRMRMYFGEETAKFYSMQIILAIEYLHRLDIIYRDLKPENILISAQGYLKLADFGFAKLLLDNRTYTLCGTPEYLAPETILNKGYGNSVDWWGVGVLIYELVGGHTPFYSSIIKNIYEKIVITKYKFPAHFSLDCRTLIRRLLEPEVSKRLGNLRNKAEDVKIHKWFSQNNPSSWGSIYSQTQPLPKEVSNHKIQSLNLDDINISVLTIDKEEDESSAKLFVEF